MKTYILTLTEEEDKLFKQSLEGSINSLSYTIIKKAWKRGDLKEENAFDKTKSE